MGVVYVCVCVYVCVEGSESCVGVWYSGGVLFPVVWPSVIVVNLLFVELFTA